MNHLECAQSLSTEPVSKHERVLELAQLLDNLRLLYPKYAIAPDKKR
jgi:hypothetical protein